MDVQRTERPRIEFSRVHKSWSPVISLLITSVAFVLSTQQLTIASAVVAIAIIVGLAYLIHLMMYGVRYLRYLRDTERKHDRLMQLYGEKETELVGRDRIISSYPERLIANFRLGAIRAIAAASNESLSDLRDKDISILEKVAGAGGVELVFAVGEKQGISTGTLLSVVTEYSKDLWGITEIVWTDEDTCRGQVISRMNLPFWEKMENDMYSDVSPPPNVKARLYTLEDLVAELGVMKGNHKETG